jgi:hypothetical protein
VESHFSHRTQKMGTRQRHGPERARLQSCRKPPGTGNGTESPQVDGTARRRRFLLYEPGHHGDILAGNIRGNQESLRLESLRFQKEDRLRVNYGVEEVQLAPT